MKNLFIYLAVLTIFSAVILPRNDISNNNSGGCSLIKTALANMPPPNEECDDRKAGDHCYTRFQGQPGMCKTIQNRLQCQASDLILPTTSGTVTTK